MELIHSFGEIISNIYNTKTDFNMSALRENSYKTFHVKWAVFAVLFVDYDKTLDQQAAFVYIR